MANADVSGPTDQIAPSDTPRTDAFVIELWGSLKPFAGHPIAELAREFEREVAVANKRIEEILRHREVINKRNRRLSGD